MLGLKLSQQTKNKRSKLWMTMFSHKIMTLWMMPTSRSFKLSILKTKEVISSTTAKVKTRRAHGKVIADSANSTSFTKNLSKGGWESQFHHSLRRNPSATETLNLSTRGDFTLNASSKKCPNSSLFLIRRNSCVFQGLHSQTLKNN